MPSNKKLKEYPTTLFEEGSPVVVDKMQLCYNSDYGVNVLQITFRNTSVLTLYGLSIIIETKDKTGEPTPDAEVEYNYYGIEVPGNRVFGASEDIVMEQDAVDFTIRVIRAEFSDGAIFRGDVRLRPMPDPLPIEEMKENENAFRERLAEKKPKLKPKFIPEKRLIYWRCTCGRLYPIGNDTCKACYLEREYITGLYPSIIEEQQQKAEEEAARIAAEEEKLRLEEEARIAEEERLKKEEEERLLREEEEARRLEREKEEKKRHRIITLIIIGICIAIALAAIIIGLRSIKKANDQKKEVDKQLEEIQNILAENEKLQGELSEMTAQNAKDIKDRDKDLEEKDKVIEQQEEIIKKLQEEAKKRGHNTGVVSVGTYNLNLRQGPGTDQSVIGKLTTGTVVEIIDSTGEWYHINTGTVEGYVYGEFLTLQ